MEERFPYELIKREVIVRQEATTDPSYGCLPEKRSVEELIDNGIVFIDKPSGPTSHQISGYVKDILKIERAGHSGTLDPKVTGVLPVTTQRATKGVDLLLKAGKEYVALMHIHSEVEEPKVRAAFEDFLGKIEQMPPIKSNVKRELRTRSIYYSNILEINGRDVLFRVGCEAGTYIRKLIHDIGVSLGTGAHMVELRRTRVGPIREDRLVTLQDLRDALYYYKVEKNDRFIRHCVRPFEQALSHIPKIWVLDTAVGSLCHGAQLSNPGIVRMESGIEKDDTVAVMTLKGELVCCGIATERSEEMRAPHGQALKTERVFMLPDVYPKVPKPKDESTTSPGKPAE